jgi:hypothetical protein
MPRYFVNVNSPRSKAGMRKLRPGLYIQGNQLYVYREEVCASVGLPCTPENLQMVADVTIETIRQIVRRLRPEEVN